MIQHAQVIAAVQASGDKEYLDWVAEPDDYAATPVENALLDKHVLLQVMPGHTSHPMHFLMAMERESGQAFVVTGQPAAVGRLIRSEPRLAAAPDLPRQAFELLTDAPDASRMFDRAEDLPADTPDDARAAFQAPVAEQGVDGWDLRMTILDDIARLQVWSVSLPWQGEPTWTRRTLATLEDEEEFGP